MYCNVSLSDATVTLSDALAYAQIAVPADEVDDYMRRIIRINLEDGNTFVGKPIALNEAGIMTGTAIISVLSLPNMAMNNHFYHESSSVSGDESTSYPAFSGILYGDIDKTTGKASEVTVDHYLKLLIGNASTWAKKLWMEQIEYDYTGTLSTRIVESLRWSGDTISTLYHNLLGSSFDITTAIVGNTIIVRHTDKDKPDRAIDEDDILAITIGFDLSASSAQVIVESPDINSHESPATVTLSSSNKVYGLPFRLNGNYGDNIFNVGASGTSPETERFNTERSYYEYTNPTDAGKFNVNVDTRYTVRTSIKGEAFDKYGWDKRMVVVDENLGRAGATNDDYLNTTFDRTSEQSRIANYYAKVLNDIEYQGSISVPYDLVVRVGDVIRLPDNKRVIVKEIRYALNSSRKVIMFGNNEGSAYEEIRARTRLSEYKAKEHRKTTNEKLYLVRTPWGKYMWMTWAQWRHSQDGLINKTAPMWRLMQEGEGRKTINSLRSYHANRATRHREERRDARRQELKEKEADKKAAAIRAQQHRAGLTDKELNNTQGGKQIAGKIDSITKDLQSWNPKHTRGDIKGAGAGDVGDISLNSDKHAGAGSV